MPFFPHPFVPSSSSGRVELAPHKTDGSLTSLLLWTQPSLLSYCVDHGNRANALFIVPLRLNTSRHSGIAFREEMTLHSCGHDLRYVTAGGLDETKDGLAQDSVQASLPFSSDHSTPRSQDLDPGGATLRPKLVKGPPCHGN